MADHNKTPQEPSSKPVDVRSRPASIEHLLNYVDPVPDDETERFIAAIYADRRQAALIPPSE